MELVVDFELINLFALCGSGPPEKAISELQRFSQKNGNNLKPLYVTNSKSGEYSFYIQQTRRSQRLIYKHCCYQFTH